MIPDDPDAWFPGGAAYDDALDAAREAVATHLDAAEPYSGREYTDLAADLADVDPLPETGDGVETAFEAAAELSRDAVGVSDSACLAHLQCPPLAPAVAAELVVASTNQSLDSFDQAPAATALEARLCDRLCELFGYPDGDGVFTGGGTESNLQGLLLARDRALTDRGIDPVADGLAGATDLRVLCSAEAHFTAAQAARVLGLGEDAVVTVETDASGAMSVDALDRTLRTLDDRGVEPVALVATAGTTDFGAIDPLDALADRAAQHDLWLHVDAAYGGALAFSERHRHRLDGVERADSLSLDFHKLLFQPLGCGAFLVRDAAAFETLARDVAYLDPDGAGPPNLVAKSLRTSRRFDALKPYVTFRALGREGVASFVDSVVELADEAAALVRDAPDLELARDPSISTVVFRYVDAAEPDAVNEQVRESLFADGEAVVARTKHDGDVHLKLTLLNPTTTPADLEQVFDAIRSRARRLAAADGEVVA